MCGIAGVVSKEDIAIHHVAEQMASSLNHRGPDDNNIWIEDDYLAMVHTRLAIQDLSANGKQPMASKNGRYILSFNGEIYNFKKLKKELQAQGHQFIGGSDTEVILASVEEYGVTKAVQSFEGMFAFSLWDKKDRELHLCRDRLGEKPLFYAWQDSNFLWASELKAFKGLSCWRPAINQSALPDYFKYGYITAPYSIYQNCFKLVPGTILTLPMDKLFSRSDFSPLVGDTKNLIQPRVYWQLTDHISPNHRQTNLDYNDAIDKLDILLCDVVTDQMISDVPYGAFLSGGIDSSLVTSVMQSLSNTPINTFTIGFENKDFNEAEFAKQISSHLGTNHHELYISSLDCLNLVPKLPGMMDEPFADSSALPAYFVSSMAREKVTVCLSGDGGDELFCGYNRYTHTDNIWRKVRKLPSPTRRIASNIMSLFPPAFYDKIYYMISTMLGKKSLNTRIGLKIQKLADLLKLQNLNQIYEMLISYCKPSDNIWCLPKPPSLLLDAPSMVELDSDENFIERAMAMDTLTYLPDDNLTKVDRTSMASSLETRLPLLNHKVVEFAWQLPMSMKVGQDQSKRILRDLLYKRVPRELIERPKMGFSVPIANWLRGPLKSWGDSLLQDPANMQHGFLNSNNVNKLWTQHTRGKKDHSAALWCILMFQAWHVENSN